MPLYIVLVVFVVVVDDYSLVQESKLSGYGLRDLELS